MQLFLAKIISMFCIYSWQEVVRAMIGLEQFAEPSSPRRGGVLEDADLVETTRL